MTKDARWQDPDLSPDGTKVAARWPVIAGAPPLVGVDLYEFRGDQISHARTVVRMSVAQARSVE